MKIDICFSGWFRGVVIHTVYDQNDKAIAVTEQNRDEVKTKIQSGEYKLKLGDLYNSSKLEEEIELFDIELH